MIVRCFWRNCSFQKKLQNAGLVDAFWVESTKKEADSCIFPLLQPSQVEKSKRLALEFKTVAADMGNPNHPFCFLVARDLSYIEPLEPHYPIHQLWNAYSPFESMQKTTIDNLESLRTVTVPPTNRDKP
jgi:hypothetical protein